MNKTLKPDLATDMLDKFVQIYNIKHKKSGSMFEDANIKDPASTNEKMEMFYEYMQEHTDLMNENPEYIDVLYPDDTIDNVNHEVYALVEGKDSKVKYISLSFISLLRIGVEEKGTDPKWNIIKL